MPKQTSAEHKRLIGRRPGLDCAGNKFAAPVLRLNAAGLPVAPPSMTAVGQAHWDRIWQAPWMLPDYDLAVVTRLCEMYEDREAMRASIKEWGLLLPASNGGRANPVIDKLGKIDGELRKLEIECGLTPAARSRLGLTEVKRQSKLDEMIRRQQG